MAPIKYCGIEGGNFGDDINLHLWQILFPNIADLNGRALFYGVGTLLDGHHEKSVKKVVLGSGIGEFASAIPDANWDFRWVRGPMTAAEFELPADAALGDAAILWPELTPGYDAHGPIGLVPHFGTWDSYDWVSVAAQAGMCAINPHQSPSAVIRQMRGCSRILAESLHGAIFADALHIPWAACILAHRFNEFKWRDWLATIGRAYAPLIMDRPLVTQLGCGKALANTLARMVRYKRHTRYPALRPVAVARPEDARAVADTLHRYGRQTGHFGCSTPEAIARQKERMYQRCASFADEYRLQFTPAALN